MNTETDKLANAKAQGQAQFDSIRELVNALNAAVKRDEEEGTAETCTAYDIARSAIEEDALSVEVRGGWYPIGAVPDAPTEYRILLCTGGPAVQIIGELSEYGEPETARLQVQDWFTPWTDIEPDTGDHRVSAGDVLLDYVRQFYFGEG